MKIYNMIIIIIHTDVIYIGSDTVMNNVIIFILSGCIAFLCIIMCLCYVRIKMKQKALSALTITIHKPLVIAIAIGHYYSDDLGDLEGIDQDIKNIRSVFGDKLRYTIITAPNNNSNQHKDVKIEWTEQEIMKLLQQQAKYLNDNIDSYDGLIIFFSCHGMQNFIFSSDDKKISQTIIHRTFSAEYSRVREIPRIVIFDCCSGEGERDPRSRENIMIGNERNHLVQQIEMTEVVKQKESIWSRDEKNPDYRLVTVIASNPGFQSKMRKDTGSYCIAEFVRNVDDNLQNGNKKFLYQILDDVQDYLHNAGKQLIESKFNNNTRHIKFNKNV
eukprot:131772_1